MARAAAGGYAMVGPSARTWSVDPATGIPVGLLRGRQWLIVAGSVGQPRDGNAAGCYLIYDDERAEVMFCRVRYDVAAAADAIRAKSLPHWLADRLLIGR